MKLERWKQLSEYEQLGNIGSAFFRASKGVTSFYETLELLDLTISDSRWHSRPRELLRLRELICDLAMQTQQYLVSADDLNKYFLGFALAARNLFKSTPRP